MTKGMMIRGGEVKRTIEQGVGIWGEIEGKAHEPEFRMLEEEEKKRKEEKKKENEASPELLLVHLGLGSHAQFFIRACQSRAVLCSCQSPVDAAHKSSYHSYKLITLDIYR